MFIYFTGAKSALHIWVTSVDKNNILKSAAGAGIELDSADAIGLEWEEKLIKIMLDFDSDHEHLSLKANVARR